jgi:hypothetical protein
VESKTILTQVLSFPLPSALAIKSPPPRPSATPFERSAASVTTTQSQAAARSSPGLAIPRQFDFFRKSQSQEWSNLIFKKQSADV